MSNRREFIKLIGGAAARPVAARAQERPERMRRVGVLNYLAADDPDSSPRVAAFAQALQELGWHDGRNIQIDYRWGGGISTALADTRPNWLLSRRMSSWSVAAQRWQCCKT